MKTTSMKNAPKTKPAVKVTALKPRKDPKAGGRNTGGGCDEFGCGTNHNEVMAAARRC